jgi:ABC-type sugar transport system permease subunit
MPQASVHVESQGAKRPIIGLSDRSMRNVCLIAMLSVLLILALICIFRSTGPGGLLGWMRNNAPRAMVLSAAQTLLGMCLALALRRLLPRYFTLISAIVAGTLLATALLPPGGGELQSRGGWQGALYELWLWIPFMLLLTSAVLDAVPKRLFESASLDRLGAWFTLRAITLPLILPTLLLGALFLLVRAIQHALSTPPPDQEWRAVVAAYISLTLAWLIGLGATRIGAWHRTSEALDA